MRCGGHKERDPGSTSWAVRYQPEDLQAYVASHLQCSPSSSSGSPNVDERLGWSLAGFFVRQGPPSRTLVWGVKDYRLADLQRDEQGHFVLVDQHGQHWKLLHCAVYHLNFIQFHSI